MERILILEDDGSINRELESLLKANGYIVTSIVLNDIVLNDYYY